MPNGTSDSSKNILEIYYQSLISSWNNESTRHWNRHNVFLVVNAGLIAIITSLDIPLKIGATIFGLLLSLLWIVVNIQGRFWQNRFYYKLAGLETELTRDKYKIFQYETFRRTDWLTWHCKPLSITKCSVYFSILFFIAWGTLLVYYYTEYSKVTAMTSIWWIVVPIGIICGTILIGIVLTRLLPQKNIRQTEIENDIKQVKVEIVELKKMLAKLGQISQDKN